MVDFNKPLLIAGACGVVGAGCAFANAGQIQNRLDAFRGYLFLGGLASSLYGLIEAETARDDAVIERQAKHSDREIAHEMQKKQMVQLLGLEEPAAALPPAAEPPKLPSVGASGYGKNDFDLECPKQGKAHQELWNYLANSEYWWMLVLLRKPVVFVCGEQRSWKSTLASVLGMLRTIFYDHELDVCDPHGHRNLEEGKWLQGWHNIIGSNMDYQGIQDRFEAYIERVKTSNTAYDAAHPLTLIVDELTNYKHRMPDEKATEQFRYSAISEAGKSSQFVIFISHGDTQSAKGGGEGDADMFERGTVDVWLERHPIKEAPLFEGRIAGLTKHREKLKGGYKMVRDEMGIKVNPEINPQYLAALFPLAKAALEPIVEVDAPEAVEPEVMSDVGQNILANLTKSLEAEIVLDEPLNTLYNFAKSRGWLSASMVKANAPKLMRQYTPEQIRSYFRQLVDMELGEVKGEGNSLEYRA